MFPTSVLSQSSGVAVSDEIVDLYNKMKLKHDTKYMLCKINRDAGEIQLHKRVESGAGKTTYEAFVADLPPKEGMYAIYDFDYETVEGGKRSKLMFVVWAPDDAPIKEKMLYASSKEGLKKKIVGIQIEVQGTDYDEVEWDEIYKTHTNSGTK